MQTQELTVHEIKAQEFILGKLKEVFDAANGLLEPTRWREKIFDRIQECAMFVPGALLESRMLRDEQNKKIKEKAELKAVEDDGA